MTMSFLIRKANSYDVARLAKLLADYMQETYRCAWGGNADLLERDLTEKDVEILLAETASREVVGFLAWSSSYDLHWCMKGGVIVDLYVCPQYRSRGAAVLLAIESAAEIQKRGGTHLKGGAVESLAVHRLYRRIATRHGENEYYVSGRAFRHLANLSGKSLREIVDDLPKRRGITNRERQKSSDEKLNARMIMRLCETKRRSIATISRVGREMELG